MSIEDLQRKLADLTPIMVEVAALDQGTLAEKDNRLDTGTKLFNLAGVLRLAHFECICLQDRLAHENP